MINKNYGKTKNVFYFKKRILQFKNPNEIISEQDLVNLFMGIYKLMKKNAQIELEEKYLSKIKSLEHRLSKFYNAKN